MVEYNYVSKLIINVHQRLVMLRRLGNGTEQCSELVCFRMYQLAIHFSVHFLRVHRLHGSSRPKAFFADIYFASQLLYRCTITIWYGFLLWANVINDLEMTKSGNHGGRPCNNISFTFWCANSQKQYWCFDLSNGRLYDRWTKFEGAAVELMAVIQITSNIIA